MYNVACGNGFPLGIPTGDGGGGGASTAADVSYDNSDSGLTADDVQAAIDELAGDISAPAAADVSYDNTDSGLTADDVQAAIDEMVANFGDGVDSVYNACVSAGSTPASKSPADIATAIGNISTTGDLIALYNGPGYVSSPSVSETYTATDDGYIFITGYGYLNSAELKVNGGSNNIANTEGYYFTATGGPVEVHKNDVITFAAAGTGNSAIYFDIYLVTNVTILT